LDSPWDSKGNSIQSQNAFIFSLTSNVKCPIADTKNAAYGHSSWGPRFGGGCDIVTPVNDRGYVNPRSYTATAQLVSSKKYKGTGKIDFETISVDVYTID
jgi:hypothetical protein